MAFFVVVAAAFVSLADPIQGQQQGSVGVVRIDSVAVVGNQRVQSQVILSLFAVQPGQEVTYRAIQRGTSTS